MAARLLEKYKTEIVPAFPLNIFTSPKALFEFVSKNSFTTVKSTPGTGTYANTLYIKIKPNVIRILFNRSLFMVIIYQFLLHFHLLS
jgi:hypothetical protein